MRAAPEIQEEKLRFIAQGCDGPCLASAAARSRLGIKPGGMVRISTERGESITRLVNKVPQSIVGMAKDNFIWMNFDDFRLLGIHYTDEVFVEPSQESFEFP